MKFYIFLIFYDTINQELLINIALNKITYQYNKISHFTIKYNHNKIYIQKNIKINYFLYISPGLSLH